MRVLFRMRPPVLLKARWRCNRRVQSGITSIFLRCGEARAAKLGESLPPCPVWAGCCFASYVTTSSLRAERPLPRSAAESSG